MASLLSSICRTSRCTSRLMLASGALLGGCDGNGSLPPTRDVYEGEDPVQLDCVPNLDGVIEASEVPLVFDVPVSYLVSPPGTTRSVDVRGIEDGDVRSWDWSIDLADDQRASVAATSLADKWYADSFPPDAFVAPIDSGSGVETISRRDERALYLLGVASAEPDPASGRTLLIYETPVELVRFPIELGSRHESVGVIEDAVFSGIPYASVDTYSVEVAALGELSLPSLSFTQAHQVRIRVEVAPALGEPSSVRQVSYFFECFGEVARATSIPGEAEPDFTEAAEVRRLSL